MARVVIGPTADRLAREMRAAIMVNGRRTRCDLLAALGGRANVRTVTALSSRLLVTVIEGGSVDDLRLDAAARGAVEAPPGCWQVVAGPTADEMARAMGAG